MQRFFWVIVAIVISTVVYFTIRSGLRPRPIPVLNATQFENLEQIGAVVYKRLRENIRQERVILLGLPPDHPTFNEIWTGFLKTALADHQQPQVVFQREDVPAVENVGGWEVVSVTKENLTSGSFFDAVKARLKASQNVLLIAATEEVTHLIKNSLGRRLEGVAGHPVLAISTLPFSANRNDVTEIKPECLNPSEEPDGSWRLGCAALRVEKKVAKKKLAVDKTWAVVERHGLKEYLLFVHLPGSAQPEAPKD